MTDGNTYAINKHLDDQEDYDALQEVTAELEQAEERIEELEGMLTKALAELERLGFDFESIVGRKLKGQDNE